MDRIPYAFADRLPGVIHYGAEVREVRRTADGGVRITYTDAAHGGEVREVTGDFCICTLPPHLLARLPGDLAPATLAALRLGAVDHAGKIGLQFKRRFWEERTTTSTSAPSRSPTRRSARSTIRSTGSMPAARAW